MNILAIILVLAFGLLLGTVVSPATWQYWALGALQIAISMVQLIKGTRL